VYDIKVIIEKIGLLIRKLLEKTLIYLIMTKTMKLLLTF